VTTLSQPAAERATLGGWLAVIAASFGCFMALLDISVVNASLPIIQGEIGASGTEGTWVTTSYLVAESVAIPLTAWLTRLLGLRTMMVGAITLFTIASVVCGFAHNLTMMIVGRSLQGFFGGVLLPSVVMVIALRLPPAQRTLGYLIFALTAVTGPIVGPVLGGWLTETISWHFGFFINVPVGIVIVAMFLIGLPGERPHPEHFFRADWLGIIGFAIGLGCLTVILEEGQREQWFESAEIRRLAVASAIGFVLLAIGQIVTKTPVIRLELFRHWRFAVVVVMGTAGGFAFYSTMFVVPQFLAALAQYNALQSGLVLLLSGAAALVTALFVPFLVRTTPTNLIVTAGLAMTALSCWVNAKLTVDSNYAAFVLPQVILGFGTMIMMNCLTQLSITTVPAAYAADASALFNSARNVGGSFGLAGIATMQDQRFWLHSRQIEETVSANAGVVQEVMGGLSQAVGGSAEALRLLAAAIERQALAMTYNDLFLIIMAECLLILPIALLVPSLPKGGDMAPAH
jgi:DHA2 family multidrug resistance protein